METPLSWFETAFGLLTMETFARIEDLEARGLTMSVLGG